MTYTSIQRLGAGSFGEVWLEHDDALDRKCAAKYLDPSAVTSLDEAFAEARAMIIAEHMHVTSVFSADELNGTPVIRMEYLPDGSIEDQFGGLPLPVRRAVQVMEDTCRGIEHLHISNLLHRDIKPGNLLVDPSGRVKVSDFGLSCLASAASQAKSIAYTLHRPPESIRQNTGITTVVGDIYAAGVTTYRLLNGDAMVSPLPVDILSDIADGRYPDRNSWQPHVHNKLRRVVRKAMHTDSAKRIQTAADFRHALEQARPAVSWNLVRLGASEWEGEGADGVDWHAEIERKSSGWGFKLSRRAAGKTWRRMRRDDLTCSSRDQVLRHTEVILERLALNGR